MTEKPWGKLVSIRKPEESLGKLPVTTGTRGPHCRILAANASLTRS